MATNQNTVYVIDDDESIRRSFERLFRSANLGVETFASPEKFLASPIRTIKACILVDLRMRGTTGFDLQKRILELNISLPVIVISASDDEQVRETARKLGAVSFFRKPVDDQALLDAVLWAISGFSEK